MTTTTTAVVLSAERLTMSPAGNPRFRLHLEGGYALDTETDASVNYDIQNAEWLDCPVILSLTSRGRVYGIEHQS